MKYFVFRNYTIEPFFKEFDVQFSGYEDVSFIDASSDAFIWFYLMPFKPDNDVIAEMINHYGELLERVCRSVAKDKTFFIFTMTPLYQIDYVTSNRLLENSVAGYNQKIYNLTSNSNVKIVHFEDFCRTFAAEQIIDWKYYYISRIPINPKLAPQFNIWLSRQFETVAMQRKKCIVTDLDNTLWHGILGEDEIHGIKMGEDYPGSAYRFFQSYLAELSHIGIILALCSKNNESDVLKVFDCHPDILLKKDMFSAYRINWNNKVENIKEIAQELNIGLESIVFIDDNPAERDLIRQALPQVSVPTFPLHPYLFPLFAKKLTDDYFCAYSLTHEDLSKTRQYKENAERIQYKDQFVDMDAYLRSLEIKLTIETLNEFNKARLAQMTQKTNQFNLTTKRYTETEIQSFANMNGLIYGLRVSDKFGDNGLTGLIIVDIDQQKASIDTFLLSCRILGKGIEFAFVKYILSKLKGKGVTHIRAKYIKTAKNMQVEKFYDSIGFTMKDSNPDCTNYTLNIEYTDFFVPEIYKLCENE